MKKYYLIFCICISCLISAQTPAWEWVKSAATTNSAGSGVATDDLGNIYFSGSFSGIPFTIDTYTLSNAGSYLAKSDASGNISWVKSIINAHVKSTVVDVNHNIIIAGRLSNASVSFFDSFYLYGDGFSDIFIAKYDSNGNAVWAKKCGGNYYDEFASLTIDVNGNPIIAGYFSSDSIMFDNLAVVNSDFASNNNALFVAKYDGSGNPLWGCTAIGSGSSSNSVTTDGSNVYLAGNFGCPTLTFGSFILNRSGANDAFLTKYDSNGNLIFAKRFGGNSGDEILNISCDASGNIIMGGQFTSTSVVYGSTTLTHTGSQSSYSSLFVKCDSNGNPLWAQSEENSQCLFVSTDADNNYYFSGFFVDSLISGGTHLYGPGGRNTFIIKKDNAGNDVWGKSVYTPLAAPSYNNMFRPFTLSQNISSALYLTGGLYGADCYLDSLYLLNSNPSSSTMFLAKINQNIVGLEESSDDIEYNVYPNPSNGLFYLKNVSSNTTIKLYSVDGKLLDVEFDAVTSALNLEALANGIYYIAMETASSKTEKKIVVVK